MKVKVIGKPAVLTKGEIITAAEFFFKKLFPGKKSDLQLNVIFGSIVEADGIDGTCKIEKKHKNGKPSIFNIYLKNYPDKLMPLLVLAHEMVHMRQYIHGHLSEKVLTVDDALHFTWKNRTVKGNKDLFFVTKKLTDVDRKMYEKFPWEKEAEKLQWVLFDSYVDFHAEFVKSTLRKLIDKK